MRLIATADLHYNHGRSRQLAQQIIDQVNEIDHMDLLLVIGDTSAADGQALEECLGRFRFRGPKLFVAGNHELWTAGEDSYRLFIDELPRRVRAAGWRWLQTEPFVTESVTIVGSIGWYDYSYAISQLGIPRRFYEQKVSPGAAEHFPQHAHLLEPADDIPPRTREIYARWNDGRFAKLHRSDEQFLQELLDQLQAQLAAAAEAPRIVAAIHHLPFSQLLPPARGGQWDFARAFLGSDRLGQVLLRARNLRHVLCGHTHFPAEAHIDHVHAINIGSGYRSKTFTVLDLPD